MPEYRLRYPHDDRKQWAYENACDCIIYGLGMSAWKCYGINMYQRHIIWWRAAQDVGNLSMV